MFGDVGDPQLVTLVAGELAIYQVRGGRQVRDPPPLRAAGQPCDAGAMHQQLHLAEADEDAAAQRELGVHATCPYVPGDAVWISRMTSVSQAWRIARADGGRPRQA
jgi:hypothetical protein